MSQVHYLPCPFHTPDPGECTNSLEINEVAQRFYCYSCRAEGVAKWIPRVAEVPEGCIQTAGGAWYRLDRDAGPTGRQKDAAICHPIWARIDVNTIS